ncbi:hypothetical protein BBO99_00000706 [Phytophthora kernoviae]|uniref:Uncharacterized protein n=2 Tax=Phytophthora kernoviae TaxID=325452 RepID=A0A3R7G5B7_9STRA|nr:hypothetical protein G195_003198 [Phytophthora kernoviae 00238/432]KAG2524677.1 hypothetical protein JM16_004524 [Phytophthora kernoviae]KAG2525975.1 hypothetical protein JM18_004501 [Phytophthora kernoviae]RLN27363.1 hypothetical protein BBI17_002751 [Phytophthora kernoviae]RLN85214.1 hypothetical protein BBO99_00000706 [Phytophthora kernoviae]
MESTKAEDQLVWFALYLVLYLAFYFFTSPFVGNRELLNSWTPYVYVSMVLYAWLFSAAALHTPVHALGLLDATIKQPISLLFPFFSASFVFLICLEVMMVLFLSLITKRLGLSWAVAHVSLARSFMNVLRNSAAISIACVAIIVHCDATYDCAASPDEPRTYNGHACEQIFSFVRSEDVETFVPASYGGAILIWCMGMFLAITNFVLERWSGIRMISSFNWFSGYVGEDDDEIEEGENGHERLPPEQNLSMVPWYSMLLFDTVFDLLISLKVFLGRFDMRTMQRALHPNDDDYCFDHLAEKDEVWLDFMADCGDGFNSSYQIARLLAQPELEVDCAVNETQMGPEDAVIVLTHEPRWLLDLYEDRSNVDAKLAHLLDSVLKGRVAFFQELVQLLCDMVMTSYVSLLCSLGMLVGTIAFADSFTILLIYECLLEVSTVRGSLGLEGEHTLYLFFSSTLPDFSAIRQYDILGLASLYGDFMKLCMTFYDVPEVVALHRNKICASGFESLSRMELWAYYASVFPYFWVLATPVVSFVFGTYLYLSLNIFGCHYNEAFSSLRIASYKNFLRLHFDKEGRLEVFAFGVDKMPRRWCRDPKWSGSTGPRAALERKLPSYQWTRPSYWKPLVTKVDNMLRLDFENPSLDIKFNTSDRSNVQLIDRVLIRKPMRCSVPSSKSAAN